MSAESAVPVGRLADWESIEAACREMCGTLAWDCVWRHTPPDTVEFFREHYPGDWRSDPGVRSVAHHQLYDIAFGVVIEAIEDLKEKTKSGRTFKGEAQLYTYLRNGLVGFRRGSQFLSGRYTRRLKTVRNELAASDSYEERVERGFDGAAADDPADVLMQRELLARELAEWNEFSKTLSEPHSNVADAAAIYLLSALHATCPSEVACDDYASIIETWRPDRLGEGGLSAGEFKQEFLTAHPDVSSGAFDNRAHALRTGWRDWAATNGHPDVQRLVMARLIGRPSASQTKEVS